MTAQQTTAHDISEGSGIQVPQPDLRAPEFRQDDPVVPPASNPEPTRTTEFQFTAEQIEKARREERQKAQNEKARLKALADEQAAELEELRKLRTEKEAEELRRQKKADKEARQEIEKDLSAKEILARREAEWEARAQETEKRFAQLEAKYALEQQVMQLQSYIQRRVAEETAAESIFPEFVDYITGMNPAEVEASIELAKEKTAAQVAKIAALTGGQVPPQAPQGVSVSAGPSSLPSDLGGVRQQSDEIDYTQMSLKEYLTKVRPSLGIGREGKGIFDQ